MKSKFLTILLIATVLTVGFNSVGFADSGPPKIEQTFILPVQPELQVPQVTVLQETYKPVIVDNYDLSMKESVFVTIKSPSFTTASCGIRIRVDNNLLLKFNEKFKIVLLPVPYNINAPGSVAFKIKFPDKDFNYAVIPNSKAYWRVTV